MYYIPFSEVARVVTAAYHATDGGSAEEVGEVLDSICNLVADPLPAQNGVSYTAF